MELELRYYQSEVAELTRQAFRSKKRSVLIVLPCGAGKTVLFAYIAQQAQNKGNRVLFLVHRRELLDQTIKTFDRFNIKRELIDIAMVKKSANEFLKENHEYYDLIIFDEAHHSTSKTWLQIIENQPKAKIVGLTATPCRLDGKPLGQVYDDMIVGITANQLINLGFLAKYDYFAPTIADLSALNKKGADYDMASAEEVLSKPQIFGDIIEHYRRLANGLQTICYCPTREYSKKIAQTFNKHGITAIHFDAETPSSERQQIIEDFRNKRIQILCNVDLVSEGFDVPDCYCCILLRPTLSTALFIQQATRALRPAENKRAVIIDHVGNYVRHGFPTQDREWSLEQQLTKPPTTNENGQFLIRQCKVCFGTFQIKPVCPYCGAEYVSTAEEIKNMTAIELKRIEEEQLRQKQLEKQRKKEEKEAAAFQKQRMDEGVTRRVIQYTTPEQCKSRYELQMYCKANNIPHKTFIGMCFKRGFIKRR